MHPRRKAVRLNITMLARPDRMVAGQPQWADLAEIRSLVVLDCPHDRGHGAPITLTPDNHAGSDRFDGDIASWCGDHRPAGHTLVDRPVSPPRDRCGCGRHCSPKIADVAVPVIDCLNTGRVRPGQQHGQRASERLDVVGDAPEARPDKRRRAAFAAVPGKRGAQLLAHACTSWITMPRQANISCRLSLYSAVRTPFTSSTIQSPSLSR